MRILVTGATGYIGSRLVAALLDGGHDVTVAARDPAKLGRFGWVDRVDAVTMDANDPRSVDRALAKAATGGLDVVYYLLHGIGEPGFREADTAAAANVARAAATQEVRRIVYLGGFVPSDDTLSEHLAGRAEVAAALHVDGGPELVWLGAAMIIGAGSTSFEMLRYVADRFPLLPMPSWAANPIDPISIADVLHYLVAAADPEQVAPGGYDIAGPQRTTYGQLMLRYARQAGLTRAGLRLPWLPMAVVSRITATVLPIPGGLAADLVVSLEHPMTAAGTAPHQRIPDPPGGFVDIDEAISRSLSPVRGSPVDELRDPHHLADTDAEWAGGDSLRLRRLAAAAPPPAADVVRRALQSIPRPVAGAVRAGVDAVLACVPGGSGR